MNVVNDTPNDRVKEFERGGVCFGLIRLTQQFQSLGQFFALKSGGKFRRIDLRRRKINGFRCEVVDSVFLRKHVRLKIVMNTFLERVPSEKRRGLIILSSGRFERLIDDQHPKFKLRIPVIAASSKMESWKRSLQVGSSPHLTTMRPVQADARLLSGLPDGARVRFRPVEFQSISLPPM